MSNALTTPRRCPVLGAITAGTLLAASAAADTLTNLWSISPDEGRLYFGVSNLERGIALNPATTNVLLLSRVGTPSVYVLDGATGDDGTATLGAPRTLLNTDADGNPIISGGTFALNLVGAADDGAVYAANLTTANPPNLKVYRWANEATDTPVTLAFEGDPLAGIANPGSGQDIRFGDNFAVRGAGAGTQLAFTSRNGKYAVILTTTDGLTFTNRTLTTDFSGGAGLGTAFGQGDTLWVKANGQPLRRVALNFAAGTATTVQPTIPTTVVGVNITGLGYDPATKRLAGVDYVAHTLSVWDASDPTALVSLGDPVPFPAANGNANGTGDADLFKDRVVALESNNGVLALRVIPSTVVDPPVITTPPANFTVYAGGDASFSVAVQGTPPFTYQWQREGTNLAGATGAQLLLTNVTAAAGGAYQALVNNAANQPVTSNPAQLTVREPLNTGLLTPAWSALPGTRPYLTTDNTQRGLAYNPATSNLLVASRSPSNLVAVLDAATGAFKHALKTTDDNGTPVIAGGTLPLNMVAASDDGVVFAGNLVTDGSAAAFTLYRWEDDSPDTAPLALAPVDALAVAQRWGDTMDIRGELPDVEILLGSRSGGAFALLTTTDGFSFTGQVFTPDGANASAFGLGIAFGPGDTVFGTANGQPLVHAAFNRAAGTAAIARTYASTNVPNAVSFIGTLVASNHLAGVALENPHNVQLFNLADLDNPVLADQELILPQQVNANGTGAADFGGGKLFVLDTNHGLRAFTLGAGTPAAAPAVLGAPQILGVGLGRTLRFTLNGTAGATYTIQQAPALPGGWVDVTTVIPPGTPIPVSVPATNSVGFVRAVAR
ncbi:MAG: immunoglobulin domain-containing protein [Limisphaerales bacterium]